MTLWDALKPCRFSREIKQKNSMCTYLFCVLMIAHRFDWTMNVDLFSDYLWTPSISQIDWVGSFSRPYYWLHLRSLFCPFYSGNVVCPSYTGKSIKPNIVEYQNDNRTYFSGIHSILMRSSRTFSISWVCTFFIQFLVIQRLFWIYRSTLQFTDFLQSLNTNWKCSVIVCNMQIHNLTKPFWFTAKFYSM